MKSVQYLIIGIMLSLVTIHAAEVSPSDLKISRDGQWLLVSDFPGQRFFIRNTAGTESWEISNNLAAGTMAQWSGDNRRVGFKIVSENASGQRLQAPAVLDLETQRIHLLHDFAPQVGNPSFSQNGLIAFTIDDTVLVVDGAQFQIQFRFDIPDYCNWTAISPDGSSILYNDASDRIFQFQPSTGSHTAITPENQAFCRPIWSPDGKHVLISSIDGVLYACTLPDAQLKNLGRLDNPSWHSDSLRLTAVERLMQNDRVTGTQLIEMNRDGSRKTVIDTPSCHPVSPCVALDRNVLIYLDETSGSIVKATSDSHGKSSLSHIDIPAHSKQIRSPQPCSDVKWNEATDDRAIAHIRGVPYHHQVYCTPWAFDGDWACNATAATMAIAYYGIFSPWDFTASTPYSHTSHYGNYVSEIYSYNGHTYNVGSDDASGDIAYGGYGYIVQGDWEDTRTHMMEYISYHNISSPYVDWSPTWAELQTETANRTPFVLLSSITTSGHYKTVVGYHEGQHTAYFNDPYGNKNSGYMNFNGAGVSYDWPGYNNGYSNLNTVHCYIYARGSVPVLEPGTGTDPIVIANFPYSDSNTTRSSGGDDLFNYYSCASTVNETGREKIYRFTVASAGNLTASVTCDGAVDIDLHLLSSASADSCIRRADISFTEHVTAGTYYLACDTYVNASSVELMGDYTLSCSFSPDVVPTATPTHSPTPTQTPPPTTPPTLTPTRTFTPSPAPSSTPTQVTTSSPTPTSTIPAVPATGHHGILLMLIGITVVLFIRVLRG